MKRHLLIGLILISALILVGCSYKRNPTMNADLTQEGWISEVDSNPVKWTAGADKWFLTGDPNATEVDTRNAPYSAAISTTSVKVPNFTKIKLNGNFQVQIFGTYGNNSVYVYGPNDAVRETAIEVRGDTLCVNQAPKARQDIRQVIVRIGVNQLQSLVQLGGGTVEGVQLHSYGLDVVNMGRGNMYLAGNMNLKTLINTGSGCVNVFGANTPVLDIKTGGSGITNVSGNVGIRSIMHHGRTDVNIIGANSDNLKIYADGRGKIGIKGIVNLRELKARDFTRVYIMRLRTTEAYVYAFDKAQVGLAGSAGSIYIDAFKNACVSARNLCANTAYVRAHQWAHINIAASNKIFAAATDNASIYFFGSPNVMSQFVSNNGTVIPIWSNNGSMCPVAQPIQEYVPPPMPARSYKVDHTNYKGNYKGERMSGFPYSGWKRVKPKPTQGAG